MARNRPNRRRDRTDNPPPPPADKPTTTHEKSDLKRPSFWLSLFTLVVVGAYLFLAYYQIQQTQTANAIAKKALSEANRPYVMFNAINPNHSVDTRGEHLRVGFSFTNWGNSPAHYLRYVDCDPVVVNSGVEPELRCNMSEKASAESDLGPKQAVSFAGSIINEADLKETRDDKKSIYIMGYVTYQDSIDTNAYGNPEQRETRICQKIQVPTLRAIQMATSEVTAALDSTSSVQQTVHLPAPMAPIVGQGCAGFSCMDGACPKMR